MRGLARNDRCPSVECEAPGRSGDRLRRPVGDNFAVIDAPCQLVQAQTVAAKLPLQSRQLQPSQISERLGTCLTTLRPKPDALQL